MEGEWADHLNYDIVDEEIAGSWHGSADDSRNAVWVLP